MPLTAVTSCALCADKGIVEVIELRTTIATGSLLAVACHQGGVGALPEGSATAQGRGGSSVGVVVDSVVPAVPEGLQTAETHSREGRILSVTLSRSTKTMCRTTEPCFQTQCVHCTWRPWAALQNTQVVVSNHNFSYKLQQQVCLKVADNWHDNAAVPCFPPGTGRGRLLGMLLHPGSWCCNQLYHPHAPATWPSWQRRCQQQSSGPLW